MDDQGRAVVDPGDDLARRVADLVEGFLPDVVFHVQAGGVVWASAAAGRVLGLRPDELVGTRLTAFVHPDDLARLEGWAAAEVLAGREVDPVDLRVRGSGDVWTPVQARMQPLTDASGAVTGAVVAWREVGANTSHAAAQAFATLAEGTRVLLRSSSEQDLLQQMCEAACTASGYVFAWYGVPVDDEDRSVRVVAVGGEDFGYTQNLRVSWGDGPTGQGPSGRCLRTGTTQVALDLARDPQFAPWRAKAMERGIGAAIALPVRCDGRMHGALMVYASTTDAFDQQAVELLEYLAGDLGFGLARLRGVAALAASEERYRLLAEHATDVVFLTGPDRRVEWVSPSVQAVTGWPPRDLLGQQLARDYLHPDDAKRIAAVLADAPRDAALSGRFRLRCADGSYRWMSVGGRGVSNPDGSLRGRVVSMRDISEQVAAEEDLRRREAQFRLLAENAMDIVLAVGNDDVIQWVSPSVRAVLGYHPEDLVGKTAAALLTPDGVGLVPRVAGRARAGMVTTIRPQFRAADGRLLWVEATARPLHDDRGEVIGRVIAVKDIDEQVRAQQDLEREVAFDGLTGLAKKPLAVARIRKILDGRSQPGWALLCVGIRNLRSVNQAFTYEAGDQVLRTVSGRLVAAAGGPDQVARIAGDEFVILLPDLVTETDAADAAERLLAAAHGPVDLGPARVEVSTCVGIAVSSGAEEPEALLRDATAAMRLASQAGPDRWTFLDGDVADRSRRDLDIQSRLREALPAGHIAAWVMPIVSLADETVRGYEALVRWIQPDGTVVPPDQFLDVAERTHLIRDVDRTVLVQALAALGQWPGDVHVAVNVSAASLQTGRFDDLVLAEVARAGADPRRLHLEVTETAVFQATDEVIAAMQALAEAGVSWWVDDFGTGYSSIAHLLDLPITGIKLDRSFTAAVTNGTSRAAGLAQGLAGLADGLGLATIAEGVETAEQASILRAQGWDLGQGWLYGKPAPVPAPTCPRASPSGAGRPNSQP